jgi:hypothetical protein
MGRVDDPPAAGYQQGLEAMRRQILIDVAAIEHADDYQTRKLQSLSRIATALLNGSSSTAGTAVL